MTADVLYHSDNLEKRELTTLRVLREEGIALPTTIFVVTLVTIMISALFARVRVDRQIGETSGHQVDALVIAQSGLETYLGTVNFDACDRPLRPPDGDSVRINVTGGYADVVAHVMQRPVDSLDTWMYVVRSTGRSIVPTLGSDPQAEHTVAQFAEWQSNTVIPQAAFTAANGLVRTAGGGLEFLGDDQAPVGCQEPSVHALRLPAGTDPTPRADFVMNGAAPLIEQSGTKNQVAVETGIDWAATIGGGLVADTNAIVLWDMSYPVMLVTGDATLNASSSQGFGTLIVTGNLTIQGDYLYWYGIVLVGGTIAFNANQQLFDGFVVSGLNEQLGTPVAMGGIGTVSTTDIDYDSRYARLALQAFAGFAPVSGAWIDNWATY
jgi:hypothetical protein